MNPRITKRNKRKICVCMDSNNKSLKAMLLTTNRIWSLNIQNQNIYGVCVCKELLTPPPIDICSLVFQGNEPYK